MTAITKKHNKKMAPKPLLILSPYPKLANSKRRQRSSRSSQKRKTRLPVSNLLVLLLSGMMFSILLNVFNHPTTTGTSLILGSAMIDATETHRAMLEADAFPKSKEMSNMKASLPVDNSTTSENMDPCGTEFWMAELAGLALEGEVLPDLTQDDIGFHHITFSINGSKDQKANDKKNGTHNRGSETEYSVACLQKTLPDINYTEIPLGNFPSYQQALVEQHTWLSHGSPHKGSFVIDTDVYANPQSAVTKLIMARTLKNVDLALVYNPERETPNLKTNRVNLQLSGLQAGLIGQRHNKRTELFHLCVADILRKTTKWSIRQQRAVNQVLESPLASFLRIRWLPPEYHCWSPSLQKLSDFVVDSGPSVKQDACYFIHSHNLAKKGALEGVC